MVMNKIILIIAVFFGLFSTILFFMYNSLKKENIALETQKNELNEKIKGYEDAIQEYNRAERKASETIQKIRTVVRTVKSDTCDCYNMPLPAELLNAIRGTDSE